MTQITRIDAVFAEQKKYKYDYAKSSIELRIENLSKLKSAILSNISAIAKALYADIGKPIEDDVPMEVGKLVLDIDLAILKLSDWVKPTAIELSQVKDNTKAYLHYEARGQVLLMSAWNFPLVLAISPLIPALAAGNVIMLKTNEMAPATGKVIYDLISSIFEEKLVAVFNGDVNEAIVLQNLPFEHVFFTGSPAVGKSVMAAAAKHLSSVTLELGGKCPAIVSADAPLDVAIGNIAVGRTFNLGQTCLCIDYAIVHESVVEQVVAGISANFQQLYYVNGEYQQNNNSRIIDHRNFTRIKAYLDDALEKGARVICGGHVNEEKLIIEPTVLMNVSSDAQIMQHEVFGPILTVLTYQEPQDILDILRKLGKPLGMYIYAKDAEFIDYLLDSTSSGGVTVNGWADHYFELNLPFGGINASGQGVYHGVYGFREFSHAKSVFRNSL